MENKYSLYKVKIDASDLVTVQKLMEKQIVNRRDNATHVYSALLANTPFHKERLSHANNLLIVIDHTMQKIAEIMTQQAKRYRK